MPMTEGLLPLERIVRQYPIPIVLLSAMLEEHFDFIKKMKGLGIIETLKKPSNAEEIYNVSQELISKIKALAKADKAMLSSGCTLEQATNMHAHVAKESSSVAAGAVPSPNAVRVLVVDDSKFMRDTIRRYFEQEGSGRYVVVDEAFGGVVAVDKYKTLKPDLVLMDIFMPLGSGLDALKAIIEFNPRAKVLIVSAMSRFKDDAIAIGAKGFVGKPVKSEKLLEAVKQALS
jgi:two-component system chemotaxis response regulator CheY